MAAWLNTLTIFEQICLYIAIPATLILLIQLVMLLVGLGSGGDADADGASDADAGGLDADAGADMDLDASADADFSADLDGDFAADAVLGGADADLSLDGADGAEASHGDFHGGDFHDGHADGCGAEAHQGIFTGLNIFTVRGVITFLTLFGWGGLWLTQLGLHPLLAAFLSIQLGIAGMVGVALLLRAALRLQYDGTLDIRNAVGEAGTVYLTVPAGRREPGKVNVLVQDQLREFEAVTDSDEPIPTGAEVRVVGLAGQDLLLVVPVLPGET